MPTLLICLIFCELGDEVHLAYSAKETMSGNGGKNFHELFVVCVHPELSTFEKIAACLIDK